MTPENWRKTKKFNHIWFQLDNMNRFHVAVSLIAKQCTCTRKNKYFFLVNLPEKIDNCKKNQPLKIEHGT